MAAGSAPSSNASTTVSHRSAAWAYWIGAYVGAVLLTSATIATIEISSQPTTVPATTHSHPSAHTRSHRIAHAPKSLHPQTPTLTFGGAFGNTIGPTAQVLAIVFGVLLLIVVISKAASAAKQRSLAEAAAAAQQRQREVEAFIAAPLSPVVPSQLVLQPGEQCYWQEPAQLMELRTHTHFEGGSLGVSVRIARGLYLRPGAFRGAPVSSTGMEVDDSGTAYVTNNRIVFIGERGAKTVTLKQLAGLEPFSDGARITPSNKKPLALITGNFRLGIVIDRITRGALGGTQPRTIHADVSLPSGTGPLLGAALHHLDLGKRQGNSILFPASAPTPDHPVMTLYATTGRTLPDGRILVGMFFSVDPRDTAAFEQEARAWVASAMGGQHALETWRAAAMANTHAPVPDFVSREPSGQFSVIIPVDPSKAGLAIFGDAPPGQEA
jgi:hypothetical protein